MSYIVTRWWGEEFHDLADSEFEGVLQELLQADAEHPDVWLKHESEWVLSYSTVGRLVLENVERTGTPPRHMVGVPPARVVELWKILARGDLATVEMEEWKAGYR